MVDKGRRIGEGGNRLGGQKGRAAGRASGWQGFTGLAWVFTFTG